MNVASGGLAGAGSLTIVYPLDYARTRLASDVGSGKAQFNGLIDCLSKTASGPAGPLGLYNGFGVSVVGIVPFRGTYFGVNDTLVSINPYQKDKGLVGIASKFVCAQTAALCAAYASYPFDTVRRRLQMQSEKPQEEWVYKGTMHCFGKIAAEEGVERALQRRRRDALRTVGSALVLVMYGELAVLAGAAGRRRPPVPQAPTLPPRYGPSAFSAAGPRPGAPSGPRSGRPIDRALAAARPDKRPGPSGVAMRHGMAASPKRPRLVVSGRPSLLT